MVLGRMQTFAGCLNFRTFHCALLSWRGLREGNPVAIIVEFGAQPGSPDGPVLAGRGGQIVFPVPPKLSRNAISPIGQVAQLVERSPEKAGVGGSIPSLATFLICSKFSTCSPALPPVPDLCHEPTESHGPGGPATRESISHNAGGPWRDCPRGCLLLPQSLRLSLEARSRVCA